ncbi:hypothetical protein ACOMHN_051244 [Nucella lapillus]
MRAHIIVELASNEEHYLDDSKLQEQYCDQVAPPESWSELYASQSAQLGQEELNAEGIKQIFPKEVLNITPSGRAYGDAPDSDGDVDAEPVVDSENDSDSSTSAIADGGDVGDDDDDDDDDRGQSNTNTKSRRQYYLTERFEVLECGTTQ